MKGLFWLLAVFAAAAALAVFGHLDRGYVQFAYGEWRVEMSLLLYAVLALLSRNQAAWQGDLRAAQQWLQRYFDPRARGTLAALAQIGQLQAVTAGFEPPSIAESLEAVRAFKSRRERASG